MPNMFRSTVPKGLLLLSAFAAGNVAFGQAAGGTVPNKVGIIHIQNAIIGTKDGQKAANELQSKFTPKKQEIDKKQREIESLRAQLSKDGALMSNEQKQNLMRDIDGRTRALDRETEVTQQELDQEQQRIMQELGQRVLAVIDKYSKNNGYSLILDISTAASPVVFALSGIDITSDIVALYDQNSLGPVNRTQHISEPSGHPADLVGTSQSYFDLGSGHWIQEVSDSGRTLVLEDDSLWEIAPLDRSTAGFWLPATSITVQYAPRSQSPFRYLLVNKDDEETVRAKYVSR